MTTKKGVTIAVLVALGLAAVGVEVAAQETARDRPSTTQRRTEQPAEQAQPAAAEGTERARTAVQRPTGPARIAVRQQAPFGAILVDRDGRALYVFSSDQPQTGSRCEEDCARDWPPLLTQGDATAGGRQIQQQMLGSIQRRDGTTQVTYGGMPLYTFARDRRAGEIHGQRVRAHGGEWFLIGPDGNRIEMQPSATPAGGRESGAGSGRAGGSGASGASGGSGATGGGSMPR